jgi:NhaA family Na+:H+ antiporter
MLLLGFAGIIIVFLASRLGVRSFLAYTILGVITWFGFYESGVHATIAGVILGLMTPATAYLDTTLIGRLTQRAAAVLSGDWESQSHRAEKLRKFQWAARESISPLEYLENLLHPWVSFIIMPIFALANAGVVFESKDFLSPVAIAVAAGLVIGKPAGIFILSWLGIKAKLASLPNGVGWITLLGGGALAGIGFTMALFIAGLALSGNLLNEAKVGVLSGSTISAVTGMILLVLTLPRRKTA